MTDERLLAIYLDGFPEDGEAYARYFLSNMPAENVFVGRERGEIVSAGYLVPKRAELFGAAATVGYLSALATLRESRGKGIIGGVIGDILREAGRRGYPLVALSPFDGDYYRRYGFSDGVTARRTTVAGGREYRLKRAERADIPEIVALYEEMTRGCEIRQLFGPSEAAALMEELDVDASAAFLVMSGNRAFAFATVEHGEITHLFTPERDKFDKVAAFTSLRYFATGEGEPFIQLRAANAQALLSLPVYREGVRETALCIRDDIIAANNGCYRVTVGRGKIDCKAADERECEFTFRAEKLVGAILGGKGPFAGGRAFFTDRY